MPKFETPRCLYCQALMARKGFYDKYGGDNPLYGLVPLTPERTVMDDTRPTPLRVFQCNSCGFLVLFSEDHEQDWKYTQQSIAAQVDLAIREQQRGDES